MTRLRRILLQTSTPLAFLPCAATLLLWVQSRSEPVTAAFALGRRTVHATAHQGRFWTTYVGEWSDDAQAREAADLPAARRPLGSQALLVEASRTEQFSNELELATEAAAHRYGASDPRTRQLEQESAALKRTRDAQQARLRAGPIMETPPSDVREVARMIVIERGSARFPVRDHNANRRTFGTAVTCPPKTVPRVVRGFW